MPANKKAKAKIADTSTDTSKESQKPDGKKASPKKTVSNKKKVREIKLRPSQIRFTQSSISNKLSDGTKIGELLDDVVVGRCFASAIKPIEVVWHDGKWYSNDNRRLWVLKQLEHLQKVDLIIVKKVCKIHRDKFTTKNEGTSVQIRKGHPGGIMYDYIERNMPHLKTNWKGNDTGRNDDSEDDQTASNDDLAEANPTTTKSKRRRPKRRKKRQASGLQDRSTQADKQDAEQDTSTNMEQSQANFDSDSESEFYNYNGGVYEQNDSFYTNHLLAEIQRVADDEGQQKRNDRDFNDLWAYEDVSYDFTDYSDTDDSDLCQDNILDQVKSSASWTQATVTECANKSTHKAYEPTSFQTSSQREYGFVNHWNSTNSKSRYNAQYVPNRHLTEDSRAENRSKNYVFEAEEPVPVDKPYEWNAEPAVSSRSNSHWCSYHNYDFPSSDDHPSERRLAQSVYEDVFGDFGPYSLAGLPKKEKKNTSCVIL